MHELFQGYILRAEALDVSLDLFLKVDAPVDLLLQLIDLGFLLLDHLLLGRHVVMDLQKSESDDTYLLASDAQLLRLLDEVLFLRLQVDLKRLDHVHVQLLRVVLGGRILHEIINKLVEAAFNEVVVLGSHVLVVFEVALGLGKRLLQTVVEVIFNPALG